MRLVLSAKQELLLMVDFPGTIEGAIDERGLINRGAIRKLDPNAFKTRHVKAAYMQITENQH